MLSAPADHASRIADLAASRGIPAARVGRTGGQRIVLRGAGVATDAALDDLGSIYREALPRRMREQAGLTA